MKNSIVAILKVCLLLMLILFSACKVDSPHVQDRKFASVKFDHLKFSKNSCLSCHQGQIPAPSAFRNVSIASFHKNSSDCSTCHNTISWQDAKFHLGSVVDGQCIGCHNGATATGKIGAVEPSAQRIIFNSKVILGEDDAVENISTGIVTVNGINLSSTLLGLRFPAVLIPQKAKVIRANLKFTSVGISSSALSVSVYGEATGNATIFATNAKNLSNRNTTVEVVNWDIFPWNVALESGINQTTPNLALIIQEIINTQGWTSGMAMVLFVESNDGVTAMRPAYSYEGRVASSAVLEIEYVNTVTINRQHIPTIKQCDDCHNTTAWIPAPLFSHALEAELQGCSNCHNDQTTSLAKGMGAITNHLSPPVESECNSCHSSLTSWTSLNVLDHSNFGECSSCHEGKFAGVSMKDVGHVATTSDCISCHIRTAWIPAVGKDHSGVACAGCHAGSAPASGLKNYPTQGIPSNYATIVPYPGTNHYVGKDCSSCHKSYSAWAFNSTTTGHSGLKFCLPCHFSQGKSKHGITSTRYGVSDWGTACVSCHTKVRSWDAN